MSVIFDLSKISDFEIAKLIAKRDCLQYKIEVLDQLLSKIGVAKGYTEDSAKTPHQTTADQTTPNLDILPFTSYKTKQVALMDEDGWIFANSKGAETLLKFIKNNNGKFTLGSFEYSLTGPEKQFITRKIAK